MCPRAIFTSVFNCTWVFQDTQLEITSLLSIQRDFNQPIMGHIIWRGLHLIKLTQNCSFLWRRKNKTKLQSWILHAHYPYKCGGNVQLIGTHSGEEPIEKEFGSEWNATSGTVAVGTIVVIVCQMIPKLFQRYFLSIWNSLHRWRIHCPSV